MRRYKSRSVILWYLEVSKHLLVQAVPSRWLLCLGKTTEARIDVTVSKSTKERHAGAEVEQGPSLCVDSEAFRFLSKSGIVETHGLAFKSRACDGENILVNC